MTIPAELNLTVAKLLDCGGEVQFPDGSMIYQTTDEDKTFYVSMRMTLKNGKTNDRFPHTKEGLYEAFKFLQ